MESKKFQKTVEDFVCENCGTMMKGNGFTNHCSACLFSKHVDINPGDRAECCGGLMVPVSIDFKNGIYVIQHTCLICGIERRKSAEPYDNFDAILAIVKNSAHTR